MKIYHFKTKGDFVDGNELEGEFMQRLREQIETDKETGEHPNATPQDYADWVFEEIWQNAETVNE